LNQNAQFDSLHWFEAVHHQYKLNKEKSEAALASGRKREDADTLALTLRRLAAYQREFELLYYSFSSAKAFFRD